MGNNIGALPFSIGNLKDLMHLDLSECSKIRELPASFRNLEKLVHLNLSGCRSITFVCSTTFQRLVRLEHLGLSNCIWFGHQIIKLMAALDWLSGANQRIIR
jgi:Leucine-rich repeat (LRR) protein